MMDFCLLFLLSCGGVICRVLPIFHPHLCKLSGNLDTVSSLLLHERERWQWKSISDFVVVCTIACSHIAAYFKNIFLLGILYGLLVK